MTKEEFVSIFLQLESQSHVVEVMEKNNIPDLPYMSEGFKQRFDQEISDAVNCKINPMLVMHMPCCINVEAYRRHFYQKLFIDLLILKKCGCSKDQAMTLIGPENSLSLIPLEDDTLCDLIEKIYGKS